jgi:hypothetical protein
MPILALLIWQCCIATAASWIRNSRYINFAFQIELKTFRHSGSNLGQVTLCKTSINIWVLHVDEFISYSMFVVDNHTLRHKVWIL